MFSQSRLRESNKMEMEMLGGRARLPASRCLAVADTQPLKVMMTGTD